MKNILVVYCCLFCNAVCSQNHFILKGKAPDFLNGKKIFLAVWDTYSYNKFETKDSTIIKNSKFEFEGNIRNPSEEAFVMLTEKGNFFYFILDSGHTEFIIRPLPPRWPLYKNKLSNSFVKDSYSNLINDSLTKLINNYYLEFGKSKGKYKGIMDLDSFKINELWFKELNIIERHSDQYFSLIYLYHLLLRKKGEAERIEKIYDQMPTFLKTSQLGQELSYRIKAILSTQVGKQIMEFAGKTLEGTIFKNEILNGKTYLIAFGATWCKPCKENYFVLKKIYTTYQNKGFEIVDINLDENRLAWEKQMRSFDLKWIHISELEKWSESMIVKQFGISYIPFYLLVDKNGTIVYNSGQSKDDELIILQRILKENID